MYKGFGLILMILIAGGWACDRVAELSLAHFEVTVPWGDRFHDAVSFEGGPRIGSVRAGESWEEVRPVDTDEDGVQNVEKDLWVRN